MERDQAIELVFSQLKNKNLRKHVLAVAAVMKHLARRFNEDEATWELVGILHDIDYELTEKTPDQHGLVAAGMLADKGLDPEVIEAVKAHAKKAERTTNMRKAAYCADPVTGFVVACALIHPDKKLEPIDVPFMKNRLKEKRFAAGADRDRIMACEELGLDLDEFLTISLEAMKEIRQDLGL